VYVEVKERFAFPRFPLTVPSMSSDDLDVKIEAVLRKYLPSVPALECMQPNSSVIPLGVWPDHQVAFLNSAGYHIGFGFFTVMHGKWILHTNLHVVSKCQGGFLYTSKARIAFKDFKVAYASTLDLVGFAVPDSLAGNLGCKKLVFKRTPSIGSPIKVHGYLHGKMCMTNGTVVAPTHKALFFNHGCSTLPGFSGAPLISGANTVIGVHRMADSKGNNVGISYDALLGHLEASDNYDGDKHLFGLREDDVERLDFTSEYLLFEEEDFEVKCFRKEYATGSAPLSDELNRWRSAAITGSWADMVDDDSSFGAWERASLESADFKKEKENSETPTLTLNSGTTSTVQKKRKTRSQRKSKRHQAAPSASEVVLPGESSATGTSTNGPSHLKSVSSPPSVSGAGQQEQQRQPASPSPSTPAVIKPTDMSPPSPKGKKLSKRRLASIRKLVHRLGSLESATMDDLSLDKCASIARTWNQLAEELR
jgi:hypothetical protein